ncbi:hypothetical protein BHM03_00045457, partial [Ensete ventricosum]
ANPSLSVPFGTDYFLIDLQLRSLRRPARFRAPGFLRARSDGLVFVKPAGVRLLVQAVDDRGFRRWEEQPFAEIYFGFFRGSFSYYRCDSSCSCGLQGKDGYIRRKKAKACNLGYR